MTISIAGCGWFGMELAKSLLQEGHQVKGSTTTPEKLEMLAAAGIEPVLIRLSEKEELISDHSFFKCDVLVIAIPPKARINEGKDYLFAVTRLIELATEYQIGKIIFISSTSVYGDVNGPVDEDTLPTPDTLSGEVLVQAEKLFTSTQSFQTTIIRFAGLIGPGRDPGKFFSGKENIPNGLAPVNLIHLVDCVGITQAIIDKGFFGYIINACSPHHPTRNDFYINASAKSGLSLPHFVNERTSWKVVNSKFIPGELYSDFKEESLHR
jgi:nucleoside-diphosphate-sugar epimerase